MLVICHIFPGKEPSGVKKENCIHEKKSGRNPQKVNVKLRDCPSNLYKTMPVVLKLMNIKK